MIKRLLAHGCIYILGYWILEALNADVGTVYLIAFILGGVVRTAIYKE